jgi:asparaginyl-tRNA synthetase
MKLIYIKDLKKYLNNEIIIKGWVYNKRASGKNLKFINLRDGTGFTQLVLFKTDLENEQYLLDFEELTQESTIEVKGIVKEDTRTSGGFEILVKTFKLLHKAIDYPISPKEHGTAFLMENKHLWLRSKKHFASLRIRSSIIKAMRDFLDNDGFINVDSPIFTANACEGTTTLFSCDYFGEQVYLSQSGQLYAEASAMAHSKVYTFTPVFRAEKSKTRKHLTEFWMLEPEMAFYDLDMNMDLIENFVKYIVNTVLDKCKSELEILERDISKLNIVNQVFPRISYKEIASEIASKFDDFKFGDDFGAPHELYIGEKYNAPTFIYDFPKELKAFYFKSSEDIDYVRGCDLIGPEGAGELVGGGQREDDYDKLLEKIKDHNLDINAFSWYLDLRKYGSVTHSGFGIGLERTVAWICGSHHLREVVAFPRLLNNIKP